MNLANSPGGLDGSHAYRKTRRLATGKGFAADSVGVLSMVFLGLASAAPA
ncbi:hypothetical protein ACFU8W_44550 [Streptomyces sp. NPDC057565]